MTTLINTGTTNLDGTGSATNLTLENATAFLESIGTTSVDGAMIDYIDMGTQSIAYASVDVWNKVGFKEAQIIGDSDLVIVNNFVDVNIENSNEDGAKIIVSNAKRGDISTGTGDDSIEISAYVNDNSLGWSRTFNIDSGAGDDSILIEYSHNSEFTSYNIDAGTGNDVVDVSDLTDSADTATRIVDGGDGFDSIVISGTDNVTFSNFEAVTVTDSEVVLELTSDLLANNNADGFGLVLDADQFSFGEFRVTDVSADLTDTQVDYIESFGFDSADYAVYTMTDGTESYTVYSDGLGLLDATDELGTVA